MSRETIIRDRLTARGQTNLTGCSAEVIALVLRMQAEGKVRVINPDHPTEPCIVTLAKPVEDW